MSVDRYLIIIYEVYFRGLILAIPVTSAVVDYNLTTVNPPAQRSNLARGRTNKVTV